MVYRRNTISPGVSIISVTTDQTCTDLSAILVHALMERAMDSGLTVLITGETGTGKELLRYICHSRESGNLP